MNKAEHAVEGSSSEDTTNSVSKSEDKADVSCMVLNKEKREKNLDIVAIHTSNDIDVELDAILDDALLDFTCVGKQESASHKDQEDVMLPCD